MHSDHFHDTPIATYTDSLGTISVERWETPEDGTVYAVCSYSGPGTLPDSVIEADDIQSAMDIFARLIEGGDSGLGD